MEHPGDLNPDGLPVLVPWGDINVGESVFVPCINVERGKRQFAYIAAKLDMKFKYRTRVEGNMLGLRAWRIA